MISVIICSRDKKMLDQVSKNVAETIGVPYELIGIDNSRRDYSIFEAYNLGIEKSKYSILCFPHEDLIFHTKNWGQNVIDHFKDRDIGLIGTCGGTALPACPAPWWNNTVLNVHLTNNINTWKIPKKGGLDYKNPFNENATNAILADGHLLCMPKEIFSVCRFDDKNFHGFDCYDSDICLQILANGKKVKIVFDILIEHFSDGYSSDGWADSVEVLADKWQSRLPIFSQAVDKSKIPLHHYRELLSYAYYLQSHKFSDTEIRRRINKYFWRTPFKMIYRDSLLLFLWMNLGYSFSRFIYAALKYFFIKTN